MIWDLKHLFDTPTYRNTDERRHGATRALFYESVPYQGKKTEIFAWLGIPANASNKNKVPAMVLVHGGLGTAFPSWVDFWVGQGYAAIAMDTCGGIAPQAETNVRGKSLWERHANSGPAGWGNFEESDQPIDEQWMYHAVAAVIAGHSLLRSFEGVDPKRIGITGISWGGVLTSVAASVDTRFAAAAPVYGCGFLDTPTALYEKRKLDDKKLKKWFQLWDPKHFLIRHDIPFLWLTGTNDFAFPLSALIRSVKCRKGPNFLSIKVRMEHAHSPVAEEAPELVNFFDHILKKGQTLPVLTKIRRRGDKVTSLIASTPGDIKLTAAELVYTRATGFEADRTWYTQSVEISGDGKLAATLPEYTTEVYFNVTDQNQRVYSTNILQLEDCL